VADYELRIDPLRVFYRIMGNEVWIAVVGRKRGNVLTVAGKEYTL
jgi:hypothetical protein